MPPPTKDKEREERLSQALKANLRRRKAQARARSDGGAKGTAPAPDEAGSSGPDPSESR